MATEKIKLNGVEYLWPKRPVVVVCIDGGDPEYIEAGIKDGIIPNIEYHHFFTNIFSNLSEPAKIPNKTCCIFDKQINKLRVT